METENEVRSTVSPMPLAHPVKLLINKGLITEAEFSKQLSTDRAVYQAMFKKVK